MISSAGRGKGSQNSSSSKPPPGASNNKEPPITNSKYRAKAAPSKKHTPKPLTERQKAENNFARIQALHRQKNSELIAKLESEGSFQYEEDEEESIEEDYLKLSSESITSLNSSSSGQIVPNLSSLRSSINSSTSLQSCLICLERVKNDEGIWQCRNCFCDSFHFSCLKGWMEQQKSQSNLESSQDNLTPGESRTRVVVAPSAAMIKFRQKYWPCPNCRANHEYDSVPDVYYCYCGKQREPSMDPWLAPHTCGQKCDFKLNCGHSCVERCHSGRCAPCAIQSLQSCFCGANRKVLRCIEKEWSCQELCGRLLDCRAHRCRRPCHKGECEPCSQLTLVSCHCGAHKAEKLCLEKNWNCDQTCLKPYGCKGQHICERKCCKAGECGQCPLSLPRTCHCGKQEYKDMDCTKQVPSCGRTCQKPLSCGNHKCEQKCHEGPCGPCQQIASRACMCGRSRKEGPCALPYKCKHPCDLMKSCQNHKCGTKCCLGNGHCPPCSKLCGRKLDCGICSCKLSCHPGACPPCSQTRTNSCRCQIISEVVPCSPKRTLQHLVEKTCIGKHISKMMDCGTPPYLDCTQPCSNLLSCGNCICTLPCHEKTRNRSLIMLENSTKFVQEIVTPLEIWLISRDGISYRQQPHLKKLNPPTEFGSTEDTCMKCSKKCLMAYLTCEHLHHGPCHINECPPCDQSLSMDCHCITRRISFKCHEQLDPIHFDQIKSCRQPCPKKLSCAHSCTKLCHSGKCTDQCNVTIRIVCKCRTLKQDLPCFQVTLLRSQLKAIDVVLLECNEQCKIKENTKKQQREANKHDENSNSAGNSAPHSRKNQTKQNLHDKKSSGQYVPVILEPKSLPHTGKNKKNWFQSLPSHVRRTVFIILAVLIMVFFGWIIWLDSRKRTSTSRYGR